MKIKELFNNLWRYKIQDYKENKDVILKQNAENNYILKWMWLVFLISMGQALFQQVIQIKTFWLALSILIFAFIHSLKVSIKQNRILILNLKESE